MFVYICAAVASLIFANKAQSKFKCAKYKKANSYLILSFLPLFIVSAIRYNVGTDYFSYKKAFESEWEIGDVGYDFLSKILHLFSDNAAILFIVSSAIIIAPIYLGIKAFSVNWGLSVVLYLLLHYYFMFLNGIRQGMAIGILFYSFKFIMSKQGVKYILSCMVAALFHKSAIIMIPIYFLCIKCYTKMQYFLYGVLLSSALFLLKPYLFKILSESFYAGYLERQYNLPTITEILIMAVANISFLVILIFNYNSLNNKLKSAHTLINMQWILTLSLLFMPILPQFNRMGIYFSIYWIASIPLLISSFHNKYIKSICYILLAILGCVYFYFRIIKGGAYGVMPYQTIIFSKV